MRPDKVWNSRTRGKGNVCMWFDDEDLMGRRLPRKTQHVRVEGTAKKANVRLGLRKTGRAARVTALLGIPLVILLLAAAGWVGGRTLQYAFLTGNDRYTVRHLDIRGGAVVTAERIREFANLSEGINLFEVDINGLRREFLKHAPNVHDVEIIRLLPDCLRIQIRERVPLARIGSRGLVTDREGCVFSLPDRRGSLPVILGYDGAGRLQPGMRLQGMAQAGLELLEVCENPGVGLAVSSVEVGAGGVLEFVGSAAGRTKTVRICWPGMGERSRASRESLLVELCRVIPAIRSPAADRHRVLDATIRQPGQQVGDIIGQG